jgi:hypothetical protein
VVLVVAAGAFVEATALELVVAFGVVVVVVALAADGEAVTVEVVDGSIVVGASEGLTATTRLDSGTSVFTTDAVDEPPLCPPRRSSTRSGRQASVTTMAMTRRRCVGCGVVFSAMSFVGDWVPAWRDVAERVETLAVTPPGAVWES